MRPRLAEVDEHLVGEGAALVAILNLFTFHAFPEPALGASFIDEASAAALVEYLLPGHPPLNHPFHEGLVTVVVGSKGGAGLTVDATEAQQLRAFFSHPSTGPLNA